MTPGLQKITNALKQGVGLIADVKFFLRRQILWPGRKLQVVNCFIENLSLSLHPPFGGGTQRKGMFAAHIQA